MNLKKIFPLLGILLVVVVGLVVFTFASPKGGSTKLAVAMKDLQVTSGAATDEAIVAENYEACVTSSFVGALAGALHESISTIGCQIPEVTVDMTRCVGLRPPVEVAPVPEVAPAPTEVVDVTIVEEPPSEVVEPVAAIEEPPKAVVEPAVKDKVVAPLLAIVTDAAGDTAPPIQMWAESAQTWITLGEGSLDSFLQDPKDGKLVLAGIDIVGCAQ